MGEGVCGEEGVTLSGRKKDVGRDTGRENDAKSGGFTLFFQCSPPLLFDMAGKYGSKGSGSVNPLVVASPLNKDLVVFGYTEIPEFG